MPAENSRLDRDVVRSRRSPPGALQPDRAPDDVADDAVWSGLVGGPAPAAVHLSWVSVVPASGGRRVRRNLPEDRALSMTESRRSAPLGWRT